MLRVSAWDLRACLLIWCADVMKEVECVFCPNFDMKQSKTIKNIHRNINCIWFETSRRQRESVNDRSSPLCLGVKKLVVSSFSYVFFSLSKVVKCSLVVAHSLEIQQQQQINCAFCCGDKRTFFKHLSGHYFISLKVLQPYYFLVLGGLLEILTACVTEASYIVYLVQLPLLFLNDIVK